jgi:hypothetical protein
MKKAVVLFLVAVVGFAPLAAAMARKPAIFPVTVKVDFGPAQRSPVSQTFLVEKGTTPKEAVSQVLPILSGKTCCSPSELMAIDGVSVDPAKNWWWTCAVNGSKNISPQKTKLKRGDVVEWKYIEEAQ